MKREDAIFELSRHLMQCGMLMPIGWLEVNGEGSKFDEAYRMAIDALKSPAVVSCRDCAAHTRCAAERIYLSEDIAEPYCCRGVRRTPDEAH